MDPADQIAQEEEIEVLQSIYQPDEMTVEKRDDGLWEVLALVSVTVPETFVIKYELDSSICTLKVGHLPPIKVKMTLSKNYPSKAPPALTISCIWLEYRDIRKLRSFLQCNWSQNQGSPLIYTWIEALRAEALEIVGKTNGLDFHQITALRTSSYSRNPQKRSISRLPRSVVQYIEAYNNEKTRETYLKSHVNCEICFNKKLGQDSIKFSPCQHTFCRECVRDYFTVLVNEGCSMAVKCPGFECKTEVTQTQVREILPPELFEKYDKSLLDTTLDSMRDIVYCARPRCNYPFTSAPEEKVAMCPYCHFAFCTFCRMAFHGVEPCRLNPDETKKLVENYQTCTPEERETLESRYGKKQIENLVNNTLSESWMKENGKRCPKCNIVIEKTDGCNKMTCYRCKTYFCWLCGAQLDAKTPYLHFQGPKSSCKLFELDADENVELDDWVEWDDNEDEDE